MTSHNRAALIGFLYTLPFIILNFVVTLRLEPLYSFLGSFPAIRNSPYIPLILLFLFPIGAFIVTRPMLQKGITGTRTFYALNAVLALIILGVFVVFSYGLGQDLYRCEVLKIPNCD